MRWHGPGALAALVVAATLASPARAAEPAPAPQVSIDEALALFRAHSPRLASQRTAIDAAEADVTQAGVLPNPTLGYSVSHTLAGTDTMGTTLHQVQLDWPLLVFGQRGARRAAATRKLDATTRHVGADYASQAHELRVAFVELLAAQERVKRYEGALADLEAIEKIVVGRAAAGAKSPYDVERIKLAHATLRARADDARADRQAAAGALAALVGIPGWLPEAKGELKPSGLAADAEAMWAQSEQQRPDLVAAGADVRAAEAGVDAAEHERLPVPTLTLGGLAWTQEPGQGIVLGVSVPLPLFDRAQGTIAQARAEQKRAQMERLALTSQARTALELAVRTLTGRRAQLEAFERDVMQHLDGVRRMAEDSYKGGQGGILELLDALDAITEAELRHVDLLAQVMAAEVDVASAAGLVDIDYRP